MRLGMKHLWSLKRMGELGQTNPVYKWGSYLKIKLKLSFVLKWVWMNVAKFKKNPGFHQLSILTLFFYKKHKNQLRTLLIKSHPGFPVQIRMSFVSIFKVNYILSFMKVFMIIFIFIRLFHVRNVFLVHNTGPYSYK